MVSIELELISFVVVVLLDHISCVVNILGVLMPYVFHDNRRRVWHLFSFDNISVKVSIFHLVPPVQDIVLVVNNYTKALRMSSFIH